MNLRMILLTHSKLIVNKIIYSPKSSMHWCLHVNSLKSTWKKVITFFSTTTLHEKISFYIQSVWNECYRIYERKDATTLTRVFFRTSKDT